MKPQNPKKCFVIDCVTYYRDFRFWFFCHFALELPLQGRRCWELSLLRETTLQCFSFGDMLCFSFPSFPVQVGSMQPGKEQREEEVSLIHCGNLLLIWFHAGCLAHWTSLHHSEMSPRLSSLWYLNTTWPSALLSSQCSSEGSTNAVFSSNNHNYLQLFCEQLFLSALDGYGAYEGKKTVFQHLHLSNFHNLYNFQSAARKLHFSSKLGLLYDQSLGHFWIMQ